MLRTLKKKPKSVLAKSKCIKKNKSSVEFVPNKEVKKYGYHSSTYF